MLPVYPCRFLPVQVLPMGGKLCNKDTGTNGMEKVSVGYYHHSLLATRQQDVETIQVSQEAGLTGADQ